MKIARYGWVRDIPDIRDQPRVAKAVKLPPKVDLRDTGHLPEVYDQGQLGSCTANASGAAAEYAQGKQGLTPVMPSRLFIYYNERVIEGTVSQDSGAQIRDAVKVLNKYGVCPESEWPYDISQFAAKPPKQDYSDALGERALTYASVSQGAIPMKQALAQGAPIIVGFTVYDSFESDKVANNGIVPMPKTSEHVQGGHAVLVVGYETVARKNYWIVRNSWGSGWGDAGYFYMPQAYFTNANLSGDFWTLGLVGK